MAREFGQMNEDQKNEALDRALEGGQPIRGEMAEFARRTRVREQYERYDTIVIGPGARDISKGWFNTWAEFANASRIVWFAGRDPNIGLSYTNVAQERTDWAQDFYQLAIEFIAPVGFADFEGEPLDAQFFPLIFTTQVPQDMAFSMKLAQSDTILEIPGTHAPGGTGPGGMVLDQSAAATTYAGHNGQSLLRNTWQWPEPVLIPAKGTIQVTAELSNPLKEFLSLYTACPGFKNIPMCPPDPDGATNPLANWFKIRVTHRGPRYLQIRGARSS